MCHGLSVVLLYLSRTVLWREIHPSNTSSRILTMPDYTTYSRRLTGETLPNPLVQTLSIVMPAYCYIWKCFVKVRRLYCSTYQVRRLYCSTYQVRRLYCSTYQVRRLYCSTYQVRRIYCSTYQVRRLYCSTYIISIQPDDSWT